MTTIIAGRFGQQEDVQNAIDVVTRAGFAADRISSFYVNPAGQHDQYPIGGDRDESPGSEDSGEGSAAGMTGGGAVGAVAGIAAIPLMGPAGPILGGLVGAHVGSLVGTLSQTDEAREIPDVRKSGMLLAVAIPDTATEQQVIDLLRSAGAVNIEKADGEIINGDWVDFNPLSSPRYIGAEPAASSSLRE